MKLKTLNFCLLLAGLTASSHGAMSFTEDFSDNSASPNMVLGTGFGSPTTSMVGAFTITSGSGSRIYLGTNDTDYSLQDFSFEADVTVPNTSSPWSIAFLGMGNSTADSGFFGEPTGSGSNPNLVMVLRNDESVGSPPSFGNLQSRYNGVVGTPAFTGLGLTAGSTYGLRMEWSASSKTATYLFDATNNGVYTDPADKSYSSGAANNLFNATNSRLFLGGGEGLVFDNIVVVPEPSAALLGGLGVLGLLRRRRA